jgi:metal-responsive CopG/Arc/MetJ family transcriptional regulator
MIPKKAWKVYIPEDLAAKVEILLADPLRGKRAYGKRNELIEALLRDWMANQQRKETKDGMETIVEKQAKVEESTPGA